MLRGRRWRWAPSFVFAAAVLALLVLAAPARAQPSDGAGSVVAEARALGLARSTEWLRLLLYRARVGGGFVSRVDDGAFFLSAYGKTDPEAELVATLRAFFEPAFAGRGDEHPRCRFAARARWLAQRLPLDGALPPIVCPALDAFQARLDPESVSVVHAANYVNNPASAFGHTFLRVKRRRSPNDPEGARLPDTGINYSARTDTENPLLYAFKGLTGLFPGFFTFEPFETMVEHYAGFQSRDLWEYELALTPEELTSLVLHLWELSRVRIHYRYLTENCSYYVLAVIDAAAPRLALTSELNLAVLPGDTVKVLVRQPGLVARTFGRPSARAASLARDGDRPAVDPAKAPERAHGSMRVSVGAGATSLHDGGFATLAYRFALHDLADRPDGVAELVQLQFMDTHLRFDLTRRVITVDALTFAEVMALNPLNRVERRPSWRLRAFGRRLHDRACADCFFHGADGAFGLTVGTADGRLAVFAMMEAYVGFSGKVDGVGGSFVRVGAGPYAGVRARLSSDLVALATGSVSYLPAQELVGTYDLRATLRGSLAKDVALGIEVARQPLATEVQFGSFVYF